MSYDAGGLAELWVRADRACEEASVLLSTSSLRVEISHAVLREREVGLLQTRDLIARSQALLAKAERQLAH